MKLPSGSVACDKSRHDLDERNKESEDGYGSVYNEIKYRVLPCGREMNAAKDDAVVGLVRISPLSRKYQR